ncbi:MAG TPA: hypothetical protein VG711_12290, partial [Phycisphaerales bacterium]|nr:hypothetical protein [Phycisphaerales bacterium]
MDSILGHANAKSVLASALRAGRLHHAWIFSGPKGVGKFSIAVELAKILLDPSPATDLQGNLVTDPASRTSTLVASRTHPDLHIIYKELALFSE